MTPRDDAEYHVCHSSRLSKATKSASSLQMAQVTAIACVEKRTYRRLNGTGLCHDKQEAQHFNLSIDVSLFGEPQRDHLFRANDRQGYYYFTSKANEKTFNFQSTGSYTA